MKQQVTYRHGTEEVKYEVEPPVGRQCPHVLLAEMRGDILNLEQYVDEMTGVVGLGIARRIKEMVRKYK